MGGRYYQFIEHGKTLDIKFGRKPSYRVRHALMMLGYYYDKTDRVWRGSQNKELARELAMISAERSVKMRGTLCWACHRAGRGFASGCPWASEFKPVPGWEAEQTELEGSFFVISCPLFEEE